jgi:hypothetical protein
MTIQNNFTDFKPDFEIIDYIQENPGNTKEILDLTFPRIFSLGGYSFYQFIATAADQNPHITEEYIKRYYAGFRQYWPRYDSPPLCECFISKNFKVAIKTLEIILVSSREDIQFMVLMYRCILRKCKDEKIVADPFINRIFTNLVGYAQSLPYVSIPNVSKKECITSVLEKSLQLIEEIGDKIHIKEFDYIQLNHTLENYPELKKYAAQILIDCQKTKTYSSLLWLLDLGNAEKNIYDREIPQKPADILYKRCLLGVLNEGIRLYESLPNDKSTTPIRKTADIRSKLQNENEFWNLIFELIVLLRVSQRSGIVIKDVQFGKVKREASFIDAEIDMSGRKILIEITSPEMQKSVLFQDAGFLANHFASAMEGKREQLNKGLKKGDIAIDSFSEPYYVIVDTTKTPLGYTCQDFFEYPIMGTDLVSGVMLICWIANEKDNRPHLKITGAIHPNPKGKNLLNEEETAELNQILNGEIAV